MPDPDGEPLLCGAIEDRWVIDQEEYMGLVKVLVRARAVVRAARANGDGSVRVPPRAAGDLRECLKEFAAVDQARRMPCRMRVQ